MAKVTIITAAIGREVLLDCVASVARQTYRDIEHWVIADGAERGDLVHQYLAIQDIRPVVTVLPRPTGHSNYYSHRIYAAAPFLTDSEWIIYLDEDNWIEPTHVESLIALAEKNNLDWTYSLRNIVSHNGKFLCRDDCQSLGWWPAYDGGYYLVDSNCYFVKRTLAVNFATLWNRAAYDPSLETPDRVLCCHLSRDYPFAFTTGLYSVNYRLGGNRSEERDREYFLTGNRIMASIYNKYPWNSTEIQGKSPTHPSLNFKLAKSEPSNAKIMEFKEESVT